MKKQYQVYLETIVHVMVYVEAESEDLAIDLACEWGPEEIGWKQVEHYFADHSSKNGDLIELAEPVDLLWEILGTFPVSSVAEEFDDDELLIETPRL